MNDQYLKLNWNAVRTLIKNIFLETDIKISVYHLDAPKQEIAQPVKRSGSAFKENGEVPVVKTPKKSQNEKYYPMLDIAEGNLTRINVKNEDAAPKEKCEQKPLQFHNLPNIFEGDKIFLQNGIKNREILERYIISYGGEVIPEHNFSEATIAVRASHLDKNKPIINAFGVLSQKKAPQVNESWLLDSIKDQKRKILSDYLL